MPWGADGNSRNWQDGSKNSNGLGERGFPHFDCWLILRGVQTLVPRMRLHCENARRVAEFLSTHPAVAVVHYPGLPGDPGHAIASRQMRDFGGMLSFEVRGGREEDLIADLDQALLALS